jgi:hypothetical protein
MASTPRSTPFDFGKFDLSKLPRLDASTFAGLDDRLVTAARDAAYITIGFGVLTFQQAQVRRRELAHALSEHFGTSRTQVEDLISGFETQLRKLEKPLDELEARLDSTVDRIESVLPQQLATVVGQAHDIAKSARAQVRGLIRSAA